MSEIEKMILMPIPERDFDPSETSIPWKILTENSVQVVFATPSGIPGTADQRMLSGKGLGIWKTALMARSDAVDTYNLMIKSDEFARPIRYTSIRPDRFAGIVLPGGHAPGMKPYLESKLLQDVIVEFFAAGKPVGAICHGVVLVCRSVDPKTKRSVLYDFRTTALLKKQELLAYYLTSLWLGSYYRTYPKTVEDEVRSSLGHPENFLSGPSGFKRDRRSDISNGFTVCDRNYLSGRWPGDAYRFSYDFIQLLDRHPQ